MVCYLRSSVKYNISEDQTRTNLRRLLAVFAKQRGSLFLGDRFTKPSMLKIFPSIVRIQKPIVKYRNLINLAPDPWVERDWIRVMMCNEAMHLLITVLVQMLLSYQGTEKHCLKGFCHGFYRILNSQNLYLCRRKPKNNGPLLLKIARRCWTRFT